MGTRAATTVAVSAAVSALAGALLLAGCSSVDSHGNAADSPDASATAEQSRVAAADFYVALGDSYTAGPGIPDQTGNPAGCERSSANYPSLVAQALGLGDSRFQDASCSGATIADLTSRQSTGDGVNPAQVGTLSGDDTIVTLGISGNDVDFAGVLTRCVELDVAPTLIGSWASGTNPCEAYYTSGGTNQLDRKIQTAGTNLAAALDQIKQRAPHARVYVVGYPDLLPSSGTSCAHTLGITPGDVSFLNQQELRLNSMLRSHAESADAVFVDTYTPSEGHDACSDPATRWIEPLVPASSSAPLHPNARGEQGMADAVLAAIKS